MRFDIQIERVIIGGVSVTQAVNIGVMVMGKSRGMMS